MSVPALVHQAFLYRDDEEYIEGVGGFLRDGRPAQEPAMVAVPRERLDLLCGRLDGARRGVLMLDMSDLGRNPGRIIPAIRAFVDDHPGRHVRFVGEPVWPKRGEPETVEALRHEALINLAFADVPATILCPYDAAALGCAVLAEAEATHPELLRDGLRSFSTSYREPLTVCADGPLPAPARPALALEFERDLPALRRFLRGWLAATPLDSERAADLLLALNEAAANTIEHTSEPGRLLLWQEPDRVVCQISDRGWLRDPLADRRRPGLRDERGRGLWLIHQLCDLVQLRSGPSGTTLRLHMSFAPADGWEPGC